MIPAIPPRPDVVEALVNMMLDTVKRMPTNVSSNELASAVFTMVSRTCTVMLKLSSDPAATRDELTRALSQIVFDMMPEQDRKAS